MRTEKFDNSKPGFDTDDIKYAFEYNGLAKYLGYIDVIVAEVCGENDGYDWHWILQMKDGMFRYAVGGCDYTGWDCQSSASIHEPHSSVEAALSDSPEVEQYGGRKIRDTLRKQIAGDMPFATYDFKN